MRSDAHNRMWSYGSDPETFIAPTPKECLQIARELDAAIDRMNALKDAWRKLFCIIQ